MTCRPRAHTLERVAKHAVGPHPSEDRLLDSQFVRGPLITAPADLRVLGRIVLPNDEEIDVGRSTLVSEVWGPCCVHRSP